MLKYGVGHGARMLVTGVMGWRGHEEGDPSDGGRGAL